MAKVGKDPLNNADCDMAWGDPACKGFLYVYYCYLAGQNGGYIQYDQFVLGARLQRSPAYTGTFQNGTIGGYDSRMYYYGMHNDGTKTNASSCH